MIANEKRLIDPTKYKAFLKRYIIDFYEIDAPMIAGAVERCLQKLEVQPSVDAVEVVRCKDCKHWTYDNYHKHHYCSDKMGLRYVCPENNFCCYGERRTDGKM